MKTLIEQLDDAINEFRRDIGTFASIAKVSTRTFDDMLRELKIPQAGSTHLAYRPSHGSSPTVRLEVDYWRADGELLLSTNSSGYTGGYKLVVLTRAAPSSTQASLCQQIESHVKSWGQRTGSAPYSALVSAPTYALLAKEMGLDPSKRGSMTVPSFSTVPVLPFPAAVGDDFVGLCGGGWQGAPITWYPLALPPPSPQQQLGMFSVPGTLKTPPVVFIDDIAVSGPLKVPCNHQWTAYQGFSENYDFCTKCDEKRS